MKILAIMTDAFGGFGGIAQYNRDLLTALSSAEEVTSIRVLPRLAPGAIGTLPRKVSQAAPTFSRTLYAGRSTYEVLFDKPNLIFCGHLFMAPLARHVARLIRTPFVVQLHGTEIWKKPTVSQTHALEHAAAVLCVSRHTRAQVLKFSRVHFAKAVVVPNTFGSAYRPGDREKARAALGLTNEFAVLTVGRLDDRKGYKGHDRIIRALPRLLRGPRPVIYLISGDGADRQRLEALAASLGVEKQVRFVGYTSSEALPGLYRAVDLFAMPSSGEGFGIVFLEAMASGTPALGLETGGAVDPLDFGEWGRAVNERDLESALCQAIAMPRPAPEMMHEAVLQRFGFGVFAREVICQLVGRFSIPAAEVSIQISKAT